MTVFPEPPTLQDARSRWWRSGFFAYLGYGLFALLLAVAMLEIGAHIGLSALHHWHKPTVVDITPSNPAYKPFSWAAECMKEQSARLGRRNAYFPFRLWGLTEAHGECINQDPSPLGVVRRTSNPANPACRNQPEIKIWVLGGSTVYGTLIPDWATLPSYLSQTLNSASRCVEVTNLGVESYASNQELLLLMEELKLGHVPNVVLMYDGFNDADVGTSVSGPATHLGYASFKERVEGAPEAYLEPLRRTAMWRFALKVADFFTRRGPARVSGAESRERAVSTLNNYEQNLRMARALGAAFGFKVCAFWQPALIYGHKPLVPYEKELLQLASGTAYPFQALAPVYAEAERRARADGQFMFLGGIFDGETQPLYLDWVHLNPSGNALAAQALAQRMEGCFLSQ